jgi:hypothetical protein
MACRRLSCKSCALREPCRGGIVSLVLPEAVGLHQMHKARRVYKYHFAGALTAYSPLLGLSRTTRPQHDNCLGRPRRWKYGATLMHCPCKRPLSLASPGAVKRHRRYLAIRGLCLRHFGIRISGVQRYDDVEAPWYVHKDVGRAHGSLLDMCQSQPCMSCVQGSAPRRFCIGSLVDELKTIV